MYLYFITKNLNVEDYIAGCIVKLYITQISKMFQKLHRNIFELSNKEVDLFRWFGRNPTLRGIQLLIIQYRAN